MSEKLRHGPREHGRGEVGRADPVNDAWFTAGFREACFTGRAANGSQAPGVILGATAPANALCGLSTGQ